MKRISLLIFALLASVSVGLAQGLSEPWWSFRAGVNFSNLHSPEYSTDYLTGYSVGVTYSYPLSEVIPIYIEGALNFHKRGARDNGFLTDAGQNSKLTKYEFQVPILLGYDAPINRSWSVQSTVGLYYSVAVDGTFKLGDEEFDPFKDEMLQTLRDVEPAEQQLLHRSDLGVRVGASLLYERYLFGFSYDAGLLNLYTRSMRDMGYKAQTGSFTLHLGCIF